MHAANPHNFALSITYKTFTVAKEATSDIVKWTTAKDGNSNYFNVQRSADGTVFETLGTVQSQSKSGTSNTELSYTFEDVSPLVGHNYHRLEQVDIDKKISYTQTIDIVWVAQGSVASIYPKPTKSILNIDLITDKISNAEINC